MADEAGPGPGPAIMHTYRQRVEAMSPPPLGAGSIAPPRFAPWYAYANEVPEKPHLGAVALVLELEPTDEDAPGARPLHYGFGSAREAAVAAVSIYGSSPGEFGEVLGRPLPGARQPTGMIEIPPGRKALASGQTRSGVRFPAGLMPLPPFPPDRRPRIKKPDPPPKEEAAMGGKQPWEWLPVSSGRRRRKRKPAVTATVRDLSPTKGRIVQRSSIGIAASAASGSLSARSTAKKPSDEWNDFRECLDALPAAAPSSTPTCMQTIHREHSQLLRRLSPTRQLSQQSLNSGIGGGAYGAAQQGGASAATSSTLAATRSDVEWSPSPSPPALGSASPHWGAGGGRRVSRPRIQTYSI